MQRTQIERREAKREKKIETYTYIEQRERYNRKKNTSEKKTIINSVTRIKRYHLRLGNGEKTANQQWAKHREAKKEKRSTTHWHSKITSRES